MAVPSCPSHASPTSAGLAQGHQGAISPVTSQLLQQTARHSPSRAFRDPPSPDMVPVTQRGRGGRWQCAGNDASYPIFILNQTFMFSPKGFQAQTVCTESGGQQPEQRELQPHTWDYFFLEELWVSLCKGISDNGARQSPNRRKKINTVSYKHWETVFPQPKHRQQRSVTLSWEQPKALGSPERAWLQSPISSSWDRATTDKATALTTELGLRDSQLPRRNSPFPKARQSEKSLNHVRVTHARASDAPPNSAHQPPP